MGTLLRKASAWGGPKALKATAASIAQAQYAGHWHRVLLALLWVCCLSVVFPSAFSELQAHTAVGQHGKASSMSQRVAGSRLLGRGEHSRQPQQAHWSHNTASDCGEKTPHHIMHCWADKALASITG